MLRNEVLFSGFLEPQVQWRLFDPFKAFQISYDKVLAFIDRIPLYATQNIYHGVISKIQITCSQTEFVPPAGRNFGAFASDIM